VRYVLALDQGTTSSRAIIFDEGGRPVASAQREFPQHYPEPGWVEHDPQDIWRSQCDVAREALRRQLSIQRFRALRREAMPYAAAAGYLTDEDVFRDVS